MSLVPEIFDLEGSINPCISDISHISHFSIYFTHFENYLRYQSELSVEIVPKNPICYSCQKHSSSHSMSNTHFLLMEPFFYCKWFPFIKPTLVSACQDHPIQMSPTKLFPKLKIQILLLETKI